MLLAASSFYIDVYKEYGIVIKGGNYMYRFRNIENLLGKNELENQEIFFQRIDNLNDPIELFIDLYFEGDRVLWKNLFRHYIYTLGRAIERSFIADIKLDLDDIYVFGNKEKLPNQIWKDNFANLEKEFLNTKNIVALINFLSDGRQIPKTFLEFCLYSAHNVALNCIFKQFFQIESSLAKPDINWESFRNEEKEQWVKQVQQLRALSKLATRGNMPIIEGKGKTNLNDNYFFYAIDYPENYLKAIKRLMYPNAFVACFSEDYKNSSMWGHYAEEHRGVCLRFKDISIDDKYGLAFESQCVRPYFKVNYDIGFPGINFFSNFGRLTPKEVEEHWYKDEDNGGEHSSYAHDFFKDSKEWKNKYADYFESRITCKTKDWEYEKETRIVIPDYLRQYDETNPIFKYDFDLLEAIIFGIETSDNDKNILLK